MDNVPNKELYDEIPKVSAKIRRRRLRAAGHFYRHTEEAASRFLLWVPKHGSSGARNMTNIEVLLEDTSFENISELACLMEDYWAWKLSYADV